VHVDGQRFVFPGDAAPSGFVGFDSAGLTHYGTPILPSSTTEQIATQLDGAVAAGARVVRVFAAGNDADADTEAQRLGAVLDAAASRGLWVIASLVDFYATGYHPQGDDGAYEVDANGYDTLTHAWFTGGSDGRYAPWVDAVVKKLRDHPAVFAWEIGNELKDLTDPSAFVTFAKATASRIRAIDPNHLVTTGMLSTTNAGLRQAGDVSPGTLAHQLYEGPSFDFLTTHGYDGSLGDDDTDLAATLSKPIVLEETGFSGDGRADRVVAYALQWKSQGASGYMQWGFLATSSDNGDGDKTFGMDTLFHTDYADMALAFVKLRGAYR
jgi:endo-1,4-beta-mannosidase